MFQDVWNWWIWRTPGQIFRPVFGCGRTLLRRSESDQRGCSFAGSPVYELRRARFNTPFLYSRTFCEDSCPVCVCGCGGLWCVIFYFGRPKKGGLDGFLKLSPYIQTHFSLRLFKGIWRTWTLEGAKRSTPIAHFSLLILSGLWSSIIRLVG